MPSESLSNRSPLSPGSSGHLWLVIAVAAIALVAVAGCSSDSDSDGDGTDVSRDVGRDTRPDDTGGSGTACTESSECTDGEVCDSTLGRCVPACVSDDDCAPIETCETSTGLCVPRASCSEHGECGENETCDVCLGVCTASGGGAYCLEDVNCPDFDQFCDTCVQECRRSLEFCEVCIEDKQCGGTSDLCLSYADGGRFCGVACGEGLPACPIGATCSAEQGQCVPLTGSCADRRSCEDDGDCTGIQVCSVHGICVDGCADDLVCPTDTVCSAGHCIPPCDGPEDCPDGTECVDGHCTVPGGCVTSQDCPEAETHCDREAGVCVPGCEVDADCLTATKECRDGVCVRRACRGAYACAFGQICDFDTGECRVPDEPHCATCDADDPESCGAENLCVEVQDEDGNILGEWCWVACSDDPLNVCPAGYACTELEVPTSGGGSEVRELCTRSCDRNPI